MYKCISAYVLLSKSLSSGSGSAKNIHKKTTVIVLPH